MLLRIRRKLYHVWGASWAPNRPWIVIKKTLLKHDEHQHRKRRSFGLILVPKVWDFSEHANPVGVQNHMCFLTFWSLWNPHRSWKRLKKAFQTDDTHSERFSDHKSSQNVSKTSNKSKPKTGVKIIDFQGPAGPPKIDVIWVKNGTLHAPPVW